MNKKIFLCRLTSFMRSVLICMFFSLWIFKRHRHSGWNSYSCILYMPEFMPEGDTMLSLVAWITLGRDYERRTYQSVNICQKEIRVGDYQIHATKEIPVFLCIFFLSSSGIVSACRCSLDFLNEQRTNRSPQVLRFNFTFFPFLCSSWKDVVRLLLTGT